MREIKWIQIGEELSRKDKVDYLKVNGKKIDNLNVKVKGGLCG